MPDIKKGWSMLMTLVFILVIFAGVIYALTKVVENDKAQKQKIETQRRANYYYIGE